MHRDQGPPVPDPDPEEQDIDQVSRWRRKVRRGRPPPPRRASVRFDEAEPLEPWERSSPERAWSRFTGPVNGYEN